MMVTIFIIFLLSLSTGCCLNSYHHHLYINRYQNCHKPLYSSNNNNNNDNIGNNNIFNIIQERLNKLSNLNNNKQQQDVYKDENTLMIDYINYKPWKQYKIKNLNIHYKPYQQNWEEKFRKDNDDDTIYLYSIPKIR